MTTESIGLSARRLAVDAFNLLASSSIEAQQLGLVLLERARELDAAQVEILEYELDRDAENWKDCISYPEDLKPYTQIIKEIREDYAQVHYENY